ncbi:MAG: hypothetical protein GY866_24030 [Proteobacteria bacterium]|nr:hypothetical protein [Pseudomonadota bacterium]
MIRKKLDTRKMQMVAIVALTLTTTPLIMIDEKSGFLQGSLVIKVSADGRPVKNANVVLTRSQKEKSLLVTDRRGYAVAQDVGDRVISPEINLDSGSYLVRVNKSRFGERNVRVYIPQGGFVEKIVKMSNLNKRPIARAGEDTFVTPHTTVNLDASKSTDPDRPKGRAEGFYTEQDFRDEFGTPNGKRIESYYWKIVEKPQNSDSILSKNDAVKTSLIPDMEGTYTVSLTVSDGIAQHTGEMRVTCDFPYIQKKKLPQAVAGHSSSIVRDNAYIFGGWNRTFLNTTYEYNFGNDSWRERAPMRIARNHHLSFAVKGRVYIIGGHSDKYPDGISVVEVYDPEFDSWSTVSSIPTPRYNLSGNFFDGKIYTFGGTGGRSSLEIYHPALDRWEVGPKLPTPRYRHTSCVANGKIYLIGGKGTDNLTEEYDPRTGSWIEKSPMPTPRYYLRSRSLGEKIYVIGGHGRSATAGQREVEEYDPGTDRWQVMSPLPSPLDIQTMNTYHKKIYIFGGEKLFGSSSTMDTNQVYNPLFEQEKSKYR